MVEFAPRGHEQRPKTETGKIAGRGWTAGVTPELDAAPVRNTSKRAKSRQRRQDARWAARSGPVKKYRDTS